MPAKADGMRGLAVFISDIRNCKSREAEEKRINKELANIRSKFKGDKNVDGYQKKKYVCKLLFIFLLGHDVDFGHMEAVNLLSSNKYTEKHIGYLFISILVGSGSDLMKLVIQSIHNDLISRSPVFVTLALQCVANINSREMAESFSLDIPKLLVSSDTSDSIKQSCALCLLRLMHTAPDAIRLSDFSVRIIHLLNDPHMGVATSSVSLLDGLSKSNPQDYRGTIGLAVSRLSTIVTSTGQDLQDYVYYFVPAPWLSVKLLRLLQNYSSAVIGEDQATNNRLSDCLDAILTRSQEPPKSKKVQHTNARHAVLFETINLIVHMDCDADKLVRACNILGQFLQHRETNMRYMALESLCLLATSEYSHEAVKKQQETVIIALKTEYDVSVRQKAADLLYAMCDKSNISEIVKEMLDYLDVAMFSVREELVLKVAILAEKYAVDYTWYVNTILHLIRVAGDHVSEEVWYRVIQIVINQEDVQGYAAKTVFEALQASACHENMVKVGGYILGEFGNLIAGNSCSNPSAQFRLLHSKFHLCSAPTRQLLLTTYMKFVNLFPEIKPLIMGVFTSDTHIRNADVELQQRAVEYGTLSNVVTMNILAAVLEEMPPFPEKNSSILSKLMKKKSDQLPSATSTPVTPPSSGITNEALASPSWKESSTPARNDSGVSDLLGLGGFNEQARVTTTLTAQASAVKTEGLFRDIMTDLGDTLHAPSAEPDGSEINNSNTKFICKNNGVLYESGLLQIGVRGEYRQNRGIVRLYFGNKTTQPFINFSSTVLAPGNVASQLQAEPSAVSAVLAGETQMEQIINLKCSSPFIDSLQIIVQFTHNTSAQKIQIALPVTLNKFLEGTEMDANQFFQRWKLLNLPTQESMLIGGARNSLGTETVKAKLTSFGLRVLEGIDPNSENFVCAGVVHTVPQVGCLLRLEPNRQMYRLTIRTNKDGVAKVLCDLLESQL